MKKGLKMLLVVFAMTLGILLVPGAASKAAATWDAGLKQVGATTKAVTLQWAAHPDADFYAVIFNDKLMDIRVDTVIMVSDLTPGTTYSAKIYAMTGSADDAESLAVVDESETIRVSTVPQVGNVTSLTQTGATVNSVTMSWNAVQGATSYDVYRYNAYNDYTKVGSDVKGTSYTVTGLSTSMAQYYFVRAKIVIQETGVSGESTNPILALTKTTPGKVASIRLVSYSSDSNMASYTWSTLGNAVDGYEFELLDNKKKVLSKGDTKSANTMTMTVKFKKGVFTKAHVRGYIVVNGKKQYGAWSDYTYQASNKKMTATRSASGKKIVVKWKKIAGASGYKVSISTKKDSEYKRVKTVSSKKTSLTVTKCGKKKLSKKKKYYIRIEYQTKVGKKTVTSDIYGGTTW